MLCKPANKENISVIVGRDKKRISRAARSESRKRMEDTTKTYSELDQIVEDPKDQNPSPQKETESREKQVVRLSQQSQLAEMSMKLKLEKQNRLISTLQTQLKKQEDFHKRNEKKLTERIALLEREN